MNQIFTGLSQNGSSPKSGSKGKARPVIQMCSITGRFIQIHVSALEAAKAVGCKNYQSITNCCMGRSNSAWGYNWKYPDENEDVSVYFKSRAMSLFTDINTIDLKNPNSPPMMNAIDLKNPNPPPLYPPYAFNGGTTEAPMLAPNFNTINLNPNRLNPNAPPPPPIYPPYLLNGANTEAPMLALPPSFLNHHSFLNLPNQQNPF
jgi:hypothetical protein